MRKPDFGICENKEADQRLCLRCILLSIKIQFFKVVMLSRLYLPFVLSLKIIKYDFE